MLTCTGRIVISNPAKLLLLYYKLLELLCHHVFPVLSSRRLLRTGLGRQRFFEMFSGSLVFNCVFGSSHRPGSGADGAGWRCAEEKILLVAVDDSCRRLFLTSGQCCIGHSRLYLTIDTLYYY